MSIHQTIKTSLWKKAVAFSAAACITIGSTSAVQAQKANFSGEWKLNEAKSTLGQFSQMHPGR